MIFSGLAENETAPTPVLPTPRVPTEKEKEQAVEISILPNSTVSMTIYSLFVSHKVKF